MKNEYEVTQKLFLMWTTENMFSGVRLKCLIFWSILAVAMCILCIIFGWNVCFILMLAYCLYRGFLRSFVIAIGQYRNLAKLYGTENWVRTVAFGDENICVYDGNVSAEYSYDDITSIKEKDNKIWLYTNKQSVIRLYKNAFKDCNYQQFINMIKSKTNRREFNYE